MVRSKVVAVWGLVVLAAGFLVSLNSCGGGTSTPTNMPPPTASQKIQHVVIIFQENRTPDNLFQDPKLIAAGADIQPTGKNSLGGPPLTPVTLATPYDLSHTHAAFLAMYDNGAMDGASKIPFFCGANKPPTCAPPDPQFQYVNPSELQPYFQLAETYTFGDRMFQTNQGPSFPAHQFIISGTSAPSAPPNPTSSFFVAENPLGDADPSNTAGCTAPPQVNVLLIDSTNPDPATNETKKMYPCFDHPTLTDLLNANKISWRYYAPNAGSIWTGPNAIQHMCGPNLPPPNATACTGSDWTGNVVLNYTQVLTDIAAGQLAGVTWVIPSGAVSDHAMINNGTGPSWVASVVNAIGSSQFWANTAIIIAWDDWGGWYDHVPPPLPLVNSYEYGFRVPLIVVSPYAKSGYISHVNHDFGSILKFTETVFNLGTVLPGAGYADERSDDLSDCFDFSQTPLLFHTIAAQFQASHFLNDKSPPTDPDDD
jgi:phospholipase C